MHYHDTNVTSCRQQHRITFILSQRPCAPRQLTRGTLGRRHGHVMHLSLCIPRGYLVLCSAYARKSTSHKTGHRLVAKTSPDPLTANNSAELECPSPGLQPWPSTSACHRDQAKYDVLEAFEWLSPYPFASGMRVDSVLSFEERSDTSFICLNRCFTFLSRRRHYLTQLNIVFDYTAVASLHLCVLYTLFHSDD